MTKICRRCGKPLTKEEEKYYDLYEGMHWECFHFEFEHNDYSKDESCSDPNCPLRKENFVTDIIAIDKYIGKTTGRCSIDYWKQKAFVGFENLAGFEGYSIDVPDLNNIYKKLSLGLGLTEFDKEILKGYNLIFVKISDDAKPLDKKHRELTKGEKELLNIFSECEAYLVNNRGGKINE